MGVKREDRSIPAPRSPGNIEPAYGHPATRQDLAIMPIRLLPPEVSSKIAAGEVIERPASVVKELLENSLDAEASEISIEIARGGTESIRVVDNGSGIPSEQVELAFQRFATSKLSDAGQLEAISTLGFRGEALPSIAAVSRVSLVTRTADGEQGTRIDVADGRTVEQQPEGAPRGTSVTARHLFRNLPARLKFLRSPSAEASRVQTLATRYALAYPSVRFRLSVDGSDVFSSLGSGDTREVVSDVYGAGVAQSMLDLSWEGEDGTPRLSGLIGPPSVTRANRSHISLYVNGRWVQNRMLTYAVQEAYHGFLMERRFPLAVVRFELPRDGIDVNVHPSKTEIRFLREGPVFSALQRAVRETLTAQSPVPEMGKFPASGSGHVSPSRQPFAPPAARDGSQIATATADWAHPAGPAVTQAARPEDAEPLVPRSALPALRVLGQVQSTYITAEGPDGVYLIDQHAAHERVLFEQVRSEALGRPAEVQGLMEPVTVDVDPAQGELVRSHAELLSRLGFQIEEFGSHAYILRGIPHLVGQGDPRQSFLEVLDLMHEGGGFDSWEERAAYSVACHGAIRAGKTLTTQEMSELTRRLEQCKQPHTCPHGRPTMIHLTSARLEREFGRR